MCRPRVRGFPGVTPVDSEISPISRPGPMSSGSSWAHVTLMNKKRQIERGRTFIFPSLYVVSRPEIFGNELLFWNQIGFSCPNDIAPESICTFDL